jgi:hypothetical protein
MPSNIGGVTQSRDDGGENVTILKLKTIHVLNAGVAPWLHRGLTERFNRRDQIELCPSASNKQRVLGLL